MWKINFARIIAGLETPTSGSIIINSKDVTTVDPANRGDWNGISKLCLISSYDC